MNIVAISDTHNKHNEITIPECDLLIHSGDATFRGLKYELENFAKWLNNQKAKNIIFVPGNHEQWLEENWNEGRKVLLEHCPSLIILNDSSIEIEGKKIWGSPITPWFYDWGWNRARDEGTTNVHGPFIKPHWDMIPEDTDILITHGPPMGILDEVLTVAGNSYDPPRIVGCEHLLEAVDRVNPDVHIFGHIHSGHGQFQSGETLFVNASICDEMYAASNNPIIINI